MTIPLHSVAESAAPSTVSRRLRVAHDHHDDGPSPATDAAEAALDRVLARLERRRLSATEVRILLALLDCEVTVPALAETLGRRSSEIRRAIARLASRGLILWRHTGRRKSTTLRITPAGVSIVRLLLAASGH